MRYGSLINICSSYFFLVLGSFLTAYTLVDTNLARGQTEPTTITGTGTFEPSNPLTDFSGTNTLIITGVWDQLLADNETLTDSSGVCDERFLLSGYSGNYVGSITLSYDLTGRRVEYYHRDSITIPLEWREEIFGNEFEEDTIEFETQEVGIILQEYINRIVITGVITCGDVGDEDYFTSTPFEVTATRAGAAAPPNEIIEIPNLGNELQEESGTIDPNDFEPNIIFHWWDITQIPEPFTRDGEVYSSYIDVEYTLYDEKTNIPLPYNLAFNNTCRQHQGVFGAASLFQHYRISNQRNSTNAFVPLFNIYAGSSFFFQGEIISGTGAGLAPFYTRAEGGAPNNSFLLNVEQEKRFSGTHTRINADGSFNDNWIEDFCSPRWHK